MLNAVAIARFVAAQLDADAVADWKTERATWLAVFDVAAGRPRRVRHTFGRRGL